MTGQKSSKNKKEVKNFPVELSRQVTLDALDKAVQDGAERMIIDILDEEVKVYLGRDRYDRAIPADFRGYRNGYGRNRRIMVSGFNLAIRLPRICEIPVKQPEFESQIIKKHQRRSQRMDDTFKGLYLEGLSCRDFSRAISYLCAGASISPAQINHLAQEYQKEYDAFQSRKFSQNRYYYVWADGVYLKGGPDRDKIANLVILGVNQDGEKELLGLVEGYRESTASWKDLLVDLKKRGLNTPALAIADGNLGFWGALDEVYPQTGQQRCWKHVMANVLDKLPASRQEEYKDKLRRIYHSDNKEQAVRLHKQLSQELKGRYEGAYKSLTRDEPRLFTYFSFPRPHWIHLKTTNPLESVFSTIRLRTRAMRRIGLIRNATAIVYKLIMTVEPNWRKINQPKRLHEVGLPGEKKSFDKKLSLLDSVQNCVEIVPHPGCS